MLSCITWKVIQVVHFNTFFKIAKLSIIAKKDNIHYITEFTLKILVLKFFDNQFSDP